MDAKALPKGVLDPSASQALLATSSARILNPGSLSETVSCDAAIIIYQPQLAGLVRGVSLLGVCGVGVCGIIRIMKHNYLKMASDDVAIKIWQAPHQIPRLRPRRRRRRRPPPLPRPLPRRRPPLRSPRRKPCSPRRITPPTMPPRRAGQILHAASSSAV